MDDRTMRTRVVWLSLMVLVALAAFNATLHPLVKGFGLAHSRWLESDLQPVFVVDSLAREDVDVVLEMFPAEIRGRHGFRVYEILLPSVVLAAAMGVLAHFLALNGRAWAAWLWSHRPRLELPPPALVSGLVLGGLTGLSFGSDWRFPREAVLVPFVLAILSVAAFSLPAWPDARRLSSALISLNAARWFWLGFVAVCYGADAGVRPEVRVCSSDWRLTPMTVGTLMVAFLLFHWSTRRPARIDITMVSGDSRCLLETCERLTLLAVSELWLLLPLVLWTVYCSPEHSALALLSPYLMLSSASSAMARWSLQGYPSPGGSCVSRLTGSLWRGGTVALIFSLPLLVLGQAIVQSMEMPIAVPFILIGVGLVAGRPWRAQRSAGDFAVRAQTGQSFALPRARGSWSGRSKRAALGAVLALGVALVSSAHEDWKASRPIEHGWATTRQKLTSTFGYRARYLRQGTHSLVLSQNLSAYDRSRAEQLVRQTLPGDRVSVISVSLWRWEFAGYGFLLLTLAGALSGLPAVLLRKTPGPALSAPFSLLAGANGAFAVGAIWGWFWLDPFVHLAAFGLCTVMAGAGVSWARRPPKVADESVEKNVTAGSSATAPAAAKPAGGSVDAARNPGSAMELIKVDALAIEVGRGLISLIEPEEGRSLLARVANIRRQLAYELGLVLPGIRFRDNLQLPANTYLLKLRDVAVARGEVRLDAFLAIGPEDKLTALEGFPVLDPTYGMPGKWISGTLRSEAQRLGCMILDPVSVVATQITEVIRLHAPELITLETTEERLRHLGAELPTTVEMVRQKHSLLTLRDVYRALLEEGVSIRDDETILNALAGAQGDVESLVAEVRLALRRSISSELVNSEGRLDVIALSSALEKELLGLLRGGRFLESSRDRVKRDFAKPISELAEAGLVPILLTHPRLRLPLVRLFDQQRGLVVLATNEIDRTVQTRVVALVGGNTENPK